MMVSKMRRRLRRNELKRRNKKIIITSLLILCLLSVGYGAFQAIISINVVGHIVVDERCVVGNVFNFEQKDEIQEFKVPCSGTYKLETWGASGGDADDTYIGGYGGYPVGNTKLTVKQKIYVVVGGLGDGCTGSECTKEGGYNGGGKCKAYSNSTSSCGSGVGATHIATKTGLLSSLETEKGTLINNTYYSSNTIFEVASGGGGGAYTNSVNYGIGGSGGGYRGSNGISDARDAGCIDNGIGYGATQTKHGSSCVGAYAPGTFGKASIEAHTGAGGSGFYGGGGSLHSFGGGGSGYIGNTSLKDKSMYCYDCEESLELTKPEIFTVSTTGNSNYRDTLNCPNGYDENLVSKCAKKVGGYARITLISKK